MERVRTVLIVTVIWAAWWLVAPRVAGTMPTARWTADRIWVIFWPVSALVAVTRPRAVWSSLLGYTVALPIGEVVGGIIYRQQRNRLDELLLNPEYRQNFEPHHPGWLIVILVWLAITVLGCLWECRRANAIGQRPDAEPRRLR